MVEGAIIGRPCTAWYGQGQTKEDGGSTKEVRKSVGQIQGEWYGQEVRTIDRTANHLAHTSGLSNVEEVQSLGVFILAMRTVGATGNKGNIPQDQSDPRDRLEREKHFNFPATFPHESILAFHSKWINPTFHSVKARPQFPASIKTSLLSSQPSILSFIYNLRMQGL